MHFIQCACRFTENCVSCGGGRGSKRDEMKELIAPVVCMRRCSRMRKHIKKVIDTQLK